MLKILSSRQLKEWEIYYRLEPWGDMRADLRCGIMASTMANIHRSKGSRQYKPIDFMPRFDKGKKPNWRHVLKKVEMMNKMFGGKDMRKNG